MDFFSWAMSDYQYNEKYYSSQITQYNLTDEWISVVQSNPSAQKQDLTKKMSFDCPSTRNNIASELVNPSKIVQHLVIVGLTLLAVGAAVFGGIKWHRRVGKRPHLDGSLSSATTQSEHLMEKESTSNSAEVEGGSGSMT